MNTSSRKNRRRTLALQLISRGDGLQPLPPARPRPLFNGHGDADYLCGACPTVLCAGMGFGQLQGLVIRCPQCGATSRVPVLLDAGG